jgi:iron complex outermembrane receptor protein
MLMGSASLLTMTGLMGASAQQMPQTPASGVAQISPAAPEQSQPSAQSQQRAQAQQPQQTTQDQTAGVQTAEAQTAQTEMQAPEQVLVTGSLIHGTTAVGVPVTTFGQGDFKTTGSLTIADLFKNVPAVYQIPQNDVIAGGGYIARAQNVNLRNLSMRNSRQLLLVDGIRFPNQGKGGCQTDPSIIPQLAVDHVDLLTDGASATYGSDAIVGVINVILKRGYDGAISQLQFSTAPDVGGHTMETAAQLFGRTWDGGDITVSYEWYRQDHTNGAVRPYFTQDFFSFQGLDDRRNIINSDPGIISIGNPAAPANTPTGFAANLGQTCINCFSIPKGQNGVGLTWAQIAANAGVQNQRNLWLDGWTEPDQQRTAETLTFDQRVTKDISLFADAWESNRAALMHGQASGNSVSVTVPTSNPYYPVGYPGPGALTVAYDFNVELPEPDRVTSAEIASRYDLGFNVDLPDSWIGKVYGGQTKVHEKDSTTGTVNLNMVKAALGQTIAAVPANAATPFPIPSFTKPSNIPYLNLFCDPYKFTCNNPATLNYITGYAFNDENEIIDELGAKLDGPVYDLPGGTIKAAIGGVFDHFSFYTASQASNANDALIPTNTATAARRSVYSAFAQLNIPVFGNDFKFPLVEALDVETSIRYDRYSDFGSTTNPKVAFNWTVGYGLTLRGSWGTAFRAPSFQEATTSGPGTVNQVQGQGSNTILTCPQNAVGHAATPGSIAALVDPNCSAALQFLPGLSSGFNPDVRPPGYKLLPETAQNVSAGFDFAPDYTFLRGLDIQTTYWYIHIRNVLNNYFGVAGLQSGELDDPNWTKAFLTATNDPHFAQDVATLLNGPKSTLQTTLATSILFIADTGNRNIGWQAVNGIDFNASYDWDLGDWGAWNTGVTGTYVLDNKSQGGPGQPVLSIYHSALSPTSNGVDTGGALKYRARLGWVGNSGWNATGFMNFIPHFNSDTQQLPPACFQIGNAPCNASGLPQFARYTNQYPLLTNLVPGLYTFDLSIGYDTGDKPVNEYLRHIAIQLNIANILDKQAPYAYQINPPGGAQAHAYYSTTQGTSLGIDGRVISVVVTKTW